MSPENSSPMATLRALREGAGARQTTGLDNATIARFLVTDPLLAEAIDAARVAHEELAREFGDLLGGDEAALCAAAQAELLNFYPVATINPYLSLAARARGLAPRHGAVLHDNGGYGMLGMGHAPPAVLETMARPSVMANVMTPSLSHRRFTGRLRAEIGQKRGGCPFARFICMNSGSESVSVACRISDISALNELKRRDHSGVTMLSIVGSFHGRTDRPARASDSIRETLQANLASHQGNPLLTVPSNDVAALREAFAQAERDGLFIEMMLIEPVMGEGNPGVAITREFYDAARELTTAHGGLLLIDSIQAGLRSTGYLSLIDYPGFEDCEPPDMETYSKALNAGQYPLSVLACGPRAAELYVRGVYGNTMTTNPRALEVGCTVLDALTPQLRANIRRRGAELVSGLEALAVQFPGVITRVEGTGLLLSAELRADIDVVGAAGMENWLRRSGLGVIHGGKNALRFTPHFALKQGEVELILRMVREAIVVFTQAAA